MIEKNPAFSFADVEKYSSEIVAYLNSKHNSKRRFTWKPLDFDEGSLRFPGRVNKSAIFRRYFFFLFKERIGTVEYDESFQSHRRYNPVLIRADDRFMTNQDLQSVIDGIEKKAAMRGEIVDPYFK